MTPQTVPARTQCAAFDHFGGPEVLTLQTLPIPDMAEDEIILQVHTAGVGVWDAMHRDGSFVPEGSQFPMVPGAEASGTVVAAGSAVTDVKIGDIVYVYAWGRPKGGCYTQYVVTMGAYAAPVPQGLSLAQAGALGTDGLTALSGLDTLGLQSGQTLLVFGASGGIGHIAVQLAKRMEFYVIAIASGLDGTELAEHLGADLALDGHTDPVQLIDRIRDFTAEGIDGLLATAGGEMLNRLVPLLRPGSVLAHPNGVEPELEAASTMQVQAYDGEMSRKQLGRLNELIASGPFNINLAQTFPLADAAGAHERMNHHYLGKIALSVGE